MENSFQLNNKKKERQRQRITTIFRRLANKIHKTKITRLIPRINPSIQPTRLTIRKQRPYPQNIKIPAKNLRNKHNPSKR